ncbi:MAG: hypothetical protein C7B46_03395 [Sulfobacillus benefaciens]|uniref:Uncharacterized protein n=1 Tax=Sulfobacillus benefaciens TaxID=453960 RepID=A0A2T2XKL6_9FIRM|nr:MAG: hypothetical protein C7B46_03395 [Sulfobacillus benefaciens]
MRAFLAIVIAGSTAVIAALLVRSRRPYSWVAIEWLLIVAAVAAMAAEGATVLWTGAPHRVFAPLLGGFLIGAVAAWFSARKPPRPKKDKGAQ